MKEYRVSLKKPNKRFSISKTDRKDRIIELLKNVWRVRHWFNSKFGKEITIINGDQMPLHRNESASQKTLSFTGETTYVKENYMLSRERVTVYTQVSTDQANPLPHPEIVFKGKGTRTKLNHPPGIKSNWAPKGSYRLDTMLSTIANLPNRHNIFSQSNYALYILDDYSVHITDEVKKALLAKGYILVVIGGGITGDVQCNDTHIHHKLKKTYREIEAKKMIEMLRENPNKIPSPTRDDIMIMLASAWTSLDLDVNEALKQNFITTPFDGSEDYKVSENLFSLVYPEMNDFRQQLLSKPPPKTLKDLTATITPPKGVRRKSTTTDTDAPPDEGTELFDCEGDEIEEDLRTEEEIEEFNTDEEDIEFNIQTSKKVDDKETVKNVLNDLVDKVVENELRNPFLRLYDLDSGIKKDVIFLDRIMETINTSSTSTLFTPQLLRLKQACKTAKTSLRKRINKKHNLKPSLSSLEKDENENETENRKNEPNAETSPNILNKTNDREDIAPDEADRPGIFDVLSLYRDT